MASARRRPRGLPAPAPPGLSVGHAPAARSLVLAAGTAAAAAPLRALVRAAAARLRALRLRAGARVAVWRAAPADALALTFAVARVGAVLVWCNDRWDGREVRAVVRDARPAVVCVGRAVDGDLVRAGGERAVVAVMGEGGGVGADADGGPELAPWRIVGAGDDDDDDDGDGDGDDDDDDGDVRWPRGGGAPLPYAIFYTSGSTGEPKGVVLSHAAMLCQARAKLAHVGYGARTRYAHLAPLYHLGGASSAVAVALAGGLHVVLPPGGAGPAAWLAAVDGCAVDTLVVVPTVLQMLVDAHDAAGAADGAGAAAAAAAASRAVTTILYGGGACSRALREDGVRRAFPACRRVVGAYGMTEAASSVTFMDHSAAAAASRRHGSVGRAPRHVAVSVRRVADSFRTGAGAWLVGEIVTRGPHVMDGYFGRDAETAAALSPDGWLATGDLGYVDDDGYLYFVGRLKDMIKTGGENVFAGEVEAVLGRHPAVAGAAVVGVPHRVLGEAVAAAVIIAGGARAGGGAAALAAWCRQRLSPYKRPKWIVPVDRLPSNPTGKVLKHEVRAELQRVLAAQRAKL